MSEKVQEALGKMLVELQVAARLAVEPPSDNRDRGRAGLLQHVKKRFEAQQVQLYTPPQPTHRVAPTLLYFHLWSKPVVHGATSASRKHAL